MSRDLMLERFFEALVAGDRPAARAVVQEARDSGCEPEDLVSSFFWPTYEQIEKLYRADHLTRLSHHMATRLLRVLIDQNAALIDTPANPSRRIFAVCGPSELEELGAQMAVDLLESSGFGMSFAGAGIANDEILGRLSEDHPDILLIFCSAASDLPEIRALIDTLHTIDSCPNLQIAVGGGVFNRAEGLAEEIGADLWATSPMGIVEELIENPEQRAAPEQRTVGRNRRKRQAA